MAVLFFLPAGIAFLLALFILNRLRDRPQSLGLPPVEQYRGEEADLGDTGQGKSLSYKQVVKQYILKNPMLWIVCLATFFIYIIRYTVLDWGTAFLTEDKGIDIMQAAWIIGGYELAGIAGMLVSGWAMDKLFKGYGGRICAIYMLLCAVFLFLFWKLSVQSVIANGLLLWGTGFMIYGPQCLTAAIAANMVPKQVGAAAVGLTGLFAYLSTVFSGWGLGAIVDNYGWDTGLLILVISAIIAMILFIVLWNSNPHLPGSQAHQDHQNKRNAIKT
ncbi:MAG: MFS transporter [Sedimentisphaerales bacterium]|nr:MFS transporter [Sedimentisphaerales bacterium]